MPAISAKLINNIVGDKWDYVVTRWFLQYYDAEGKLKNKYTRPWSEYGHNYIQLLMLAIQQVEQLKNMDPKERYDLYMANPKNFQPVKDLIYMKYKVDEDEEREPYWYYHGDPSNNDGLDHLDQIIKNLLEEKIKLFISSDFFEDLFSNKTFDVSQAKKINYNDALNKYIEEIKPSNMELILDLGDYKWVNAGSGDSTFVRKKMKNCGSGRWGALRAKNPEDNQMLLLIDTNNNPHVIATWNPNFIDTYDENVSGNYLGHFEGIGSSPVKSKYYDEVKALVDFIKPNITTIDTGTTHADSEGNTWNNKGLVEYIGAEPGYLKPYDHKQRSEPPIATDESGDDFGERIYYESN